MLHLARDAVAWALLVYNIVNNRLHVLSWARNRQRKHQENYMILVRFPTCGSPSARPPSRVTTCVTTAIKALCSRDSAPVSDPSVASRVALHTYRSPAMHHIIIIMV